jgi:hypothetical protein
MKNIYAVLQGTKYEGYSVRGVYADATAAEVAAAVLVAEENQDGSSYERLGDDVAVWESSGGDYYVEVAEWPFDRAF